jgi:serine protease AprX
MTELPYSDPSGDRIGFTPEVLDKTVLSIPLLKILEEERVGLDQDPGREPSLHDVIIDLNLEYRAGRAAGRARARELVDDAVAEVGGSPGQGIDDKSDYSDQYLFARLEGRVLRRVVEQDSAPSPDHDSADRAAAMGGRAIYHIWPDFEVRPLISKSISTVKADAARISFAAMGQDIVWAVLDSGIDRDHPHFGLHDNLELAPALEHRDFTGGGNPLKDDFGHGTHVAGILAAEKNGYLVVGVAPAVDLYALKILGATGEGEVSDLILALQWAVDHDMDVVNMSLGTHEVSPALATAVANASTAGLLMVAASGNTITF